MHFESLFHMCRDKEGNPDYDPSNDTLLYFAWAASVVGPVLFLAAALHAVLWRWPSSAVGSVVSVKSRHIKLYLPIYTGE